MSDPRTGLITSTDGAINPPRSGKAGETIVQPAHGAYTEAAYRGNIFLGTNIAAQATSLNSTTATGLILSNPLGSNKLLVLQKVLVNLASLPAGAAPLILTGNTNPAGAATVHTTPLVPQCSIMGAGTSPVAKVDSAATIAATTIITVVPGSSAGTVATNVSFTPVIIYEVKGSIILQPGTCISLQSLTTAVSVIASFEWEEIPV